MMTPYEHLLQYPVELARKRELNPPIRRVKRNRKRAGIRRTQAFTALFTRQPLRQGADRKIAPAAH